MSKRFVKSPEKKGTKKIPKPEGREEEATSGKLYTEIYQT